VPRQLQSTRATADALSGMAELLFVSSANFCPGASVLVLRDLNLPNGKFESFVEDFRNVICGGSLSKQAFARVV
jgi:hypothetical protein